MQRLAALLPLLPTLAMADPRLDAAKSSAEKALRELHLPSDPPPPGEGLPGFWSSETTPPFPDGKSWVVYGYATKFSPRIADGIRVGSIYCAIRADGVEVVGKTVKEIAVQGVHPTPANWWPTKEEAAQAYAWVLDGHHGARPDVIAKTYCPWQSGNGVIVSALPKPAKDFLASLGCR